MVKEVGRIPQMGSMSESTSKIFEVYEVLRTYEKDDRYLSNPPPRFNLLLQEVLRMFETRF